MLFRRQKEDASSTWRMGWLSRGSSHIPDEGAGAEGDGSALLVNEPYFSLAPLDWGSNLVSKFVGHDPWAMPILDTASSGGHLADAGECPFLSAGESLENLRDSTLLGTQAAV